MEPPLTVAYVVVFDSPNGLSVSIVDTNIDISGAVGRGDGGRNREKLRWIEARQARQGG
jgi:hypothetical protein